MFVKLIYNRIMRNYKIIFILQRENNFFWLSGEFGREPNEKSNHAISLGCLGVRS